MAMIVLSCWLCDIPANAAHEVFPAPVSELWLDVVPADVPVFPVFVAPAAVPPLDPAAEEVLGEDAAGEAPDELFDGGVAGSDGGAEDCEAELPQPASPRQIAAQTVTI